MPDFLALPALAQEGAAAFPAAALPPFALALGPVRILGPPRDPGLAALTAGLAMAASRAPQQLERCVQLLRVD
eukprot:14923975-Alexandrium_andersonii.AAC.1